MKGLMALKQFLAFLGINELNFVKGKGRQFTGTPVGTVFMSSKFDKTKPAFITVAGADLKTKDGVSLEGTLWLCNGNLTQGDVIS